MRTTDSDVHPSCPDSCTYSKDDDPDIWCLQPGDLQYEKNPPSDSCPVVSPKEMFSIANQQLPGKNLDLQNAREIDNIFMRLQNAVEPKTENSRKVLASKSRVFDEFSSQYKEFLRKVHSLDNLAEVVEFGRMLTDKLPLNPEPTDEQKESLKAETVEMVSQARSTLTVFIDKRQEEIEALQKMINTANQMLENPKILRTGELF